MSVVAHLRIPADSFELGRIMEMDLDTMVELESMVPLGEKAISLFSVFDHASEGLEETVREHPSVNRLEEMSRQDSQVLYALDWNIGRDVFIGGSWKPMRTS